MISKEEVKHIAKLARIHLEEKEIEKFQKELSLIIDYFNKLKEVDTKNVDSKFYPSRMKNITREDIPGKKDIEQAEKLIDLYPQKKGRYLKTKRVL